MEAFLFSAFAFIKKLLKRDCFIEKTLQETLREHRVLLSVQHFFFNERGNKKMKTGMKRVEKKSQKSLSCA